MDKQQHCHRCGKEVFFEPKNKDQPVSETCSICSESFCPNCVILPKTDHEVEVVCLSCAKTNVNVRSKIQNIDDYPALFTGDLKCVRCDARYFADKCSIKCPNCGCLTLVPENSD